MSNPIVETALSLMQAEIKKYGLEVLQRYPNDLLVHDRAQLEIAAVPGAKIAWMVGHCHTHLVPLGVHPRENEHVAYLTKLASEDRFYGLTISRQGNVAINEVDRQGFIQLQGIPVPYVIQGGPDNFWLLRNGHRIGHCGITMTGGICARMAEAVITPVVGISQQDRVALQMWCDYGIREKAQTLFIRQTVTWADSVAVIPEVA